MNTKQDSFAGITFVGVGPGDPSLITLAAMREIRDATVVAYPISKEGGEGLASQTASEWICNSQKRLPLLFPMVQEAEPRKEAWNQASKKIRQEIIKGEKVVFLSQGDVSLFSTSAYLLFDLRKYLPESFIRVIPGVTAVSAAAAIGLWPLALQQDQLLIVPTPDQVEALEKLINDAAISRRVLTLLKLGHRWEWVRPFLAKKKLLAGALFAEKVGWPDQKVILASEVPNQKRSYFSMVFIRQKWPEVMP